MKRLDAVIFVADVIALVEVFLSDTTFKEGRHLNELNEGLRQSICCICAIIWYTKNFLYPILHLTSQW